MAVRQPVGECVDLVRWLAAAGALLVAQPALPAGAASLECLGNDYIFGRNVVSRTLSLRTDDKRRVQELDGRPCDQAAALPALACFADYKLDGTVMLAWVKYEPGPGRAVLYAYPKASAPTAGKPPTRAVAMFKGLCHED
ncbi:hypothetical protein [Azospirillum sp.]|uniref:hypothetical protein n=1 Tax=Azospirillum sp. TaxID=34012 RepID=UPI003D710C4D